MNSRSKGNRNERKAAELISVWTGKKFAKTPSSGGLQWKKSFSKGDIVCTVEGHFFPFCVEVKAHKEIDFSHLLLKEIKQPKIFEFWEQCERDAKLAEKVPMLMMRYDRLPADFFFLALPTHFVLQLNLKFTKVLRFRGKHNIIIVDSRELFAMDYNEIKPLTKKYLKNAKKRR